MCDARASNWSHFTCDIQSPTGSTPSVPLFEVATRPTTGGYSTGVPDTGNDCVSNDIETPRKPQQINSQSESLGAAMIRTGDSSSTAKIVKLDNGDAQDITGNGDIGA